MTSIALPPDRPPRIALVRTSALGDVVHALPTLVALKRRWPDAVTAWVVEDVFGPLLDGHPLLDRLVAVRLREWRKSPLSPGTLGELRSAVTSLRRFSPDVAIDLMGSHKGGILARLSGAPVVLGARRGDRREPSSSIWIGSGSSVGGRHVVERMLSVAGPLGIDTGTVDFRGDLVPASHPEADRLSREHPDGYVLVQPGAGWGNKVYPPDWWGRVANEVGRVSGLPVLAIAGPGEESLAREVAAASEGAARPLPAPGIGRLAALLRSATLVIGGDTGPVHLAHAVGTPVVAVMGPTDPRRNGPYGAVHRAVWHELPCSFCHRRYSETKACLLDISSSEIAGRALESLSSSLSPSP